MKNILGYIGKRQGQNERPKLLTGKAMKMRTLRTKSMAVLAVLRCKSRATRKS